MLKKLSSITIIAGIVVVGGLIYLGAHSLAGHYLSTRTDTARTPVCLGKHVSHNVVIQNNTMVPEHTQALLCDTLTITNKDDALRLVAFGEHDHHEPYDGVTEKLLKRGQSLTVELNETGTYHFHDHLQDVAQGDFTVIK